MPEQVRARVPVLNGGVSKQAPHLRFPGQVEAASNANFHAADGAAKRPGSRYVKKITGLTAGNAYRMHAINRDASEKYLAIYGEISGTMTVSVFTTAGTAATMSPSAAATTYLELNSATPDQIKMVTLLDTTIIVNTTVATGSLTSDTYTITTGFRDAEVMFSYHPTNATYHSTDRDTLSYPKGFWYHNTSVSGTAVVLAKQVMTAVSGATWATHNHASGYTAAANNPGGFKVAFQKDAVALTNGTWVQSTRTLTHSSLGFYSFEVGDQIYISTTDGGWTIGWYTISSKPTQTSIVLASGPSFPADNSVTDADKIGRLVEVTVDFTSETLTDMYDVALVFQNALRNAGVPYALVNWTRTGATAGYFTIVSPWGGTESTQLATTAPTSGFDYTAAGKPFVSSAITAGSGTTTTTAIPVIGRWTQVAAPGQPSAQPDPTLMPHVMTRTSVSPAFSIAAIDWTKRLSGDEDSNPVPTFISNATPIGDIAFFESRLTFGAGERIQFSADDDFFNLYKFDANQIEDSDPFDRSLKGDKAGKIEWLVPFREVLVIFSASGQQFELSAPDIFTPATAKITTTSAYNTVAAVRPRVGSSLMHYAATRARETILLEAVYDAQAAATIASEVTSHVEQYLPSSIRTIASCPNTGMVAVLPTTGTTIYVYSYFYVGGQKQQSAWTAYTYDASYRIVDIAVIDNDLYLLIESQSQYFLERQPLSRPAADTGVGYYAHLDRGISLTGVHSAGTTTWTLPDSSSDTTLTRAVLGTGTATGAAGDEITITANGTTCTKSGNYSGAAAIVGRPFTFSVQPTRPFRRDGNGLADLSAWMQHREIVVDHKEAGSYTVKGVMTNRTDRTKTFSPATGLVETAGTTKAFFNGRADQFTLTIENATAKPCTITAIQYLLDYVPRT